MIKGSGEEVMPMVAINAKDTVGNKAVEENVMLDWAGM